jgi:hypothetical protein
MTNSGVPGRCRLRHLRLGAGIAPRVQLLGDHGAMDVLSSRVLLHPTDPERSRAFYRDMLGLAIYREFGSGRTGARSSSWVVGSWSCRAALPRR